MANTEPLEALRALMRMSRWGYENPLSETEQTHQLETQEQAREQCQCHDILDWILKSGLVPQLCQDYIQYNNHIRPPSRWLPPSKEFYGVAIEDHPDYDPSQDLDEEDYADDRFGPYHESKTQEELDEELDRMAAEREAYLTASSAANHVSVV